MRVLSIVVLLAAVAQSATIYDALQASKQFTRIKEIVDRVPALKNILSDPNVQVTFFAPSDNALKNVPFQMPYRYLFPGIVPVSTMSEGSRYNYRGERIAFDMDKSHFKMRTEYIFLPGTDPSYQPRVLRAPLRKDGGLLENGNLYYIDRLVYSCGELTREQCEQTNDDQCRLKCNDPYSRIAGTDVVYNYGDLDFHYSLSGVRNTIGVTGGKAPAPAPAGKIDGTYYTDDSSEEASGEVQDGLYSEPIEKGYGDSESNPYGLGYYGR